MSDNKDFMAPNSSPGGGATKSGVRRVNNLPVYLLGIVLLLFLLVMGLVAADRSAKQNAPVVDDLEEKTTNTMMFANAIAGEQNGGIVEPKAKPLEIPNMLEPNQAEASSTTSFEKPENLNTPPKPPNGENQNLTPEDEEANRIRMAKVQMLQEAIKAKTGVQVVAPRSVGSTQSETPSKAEMLARVTEARQQADVYRGSDPTVAYQMRLAQIRNGLGQTDAATAPELLQTAKNDISQFDNKSGADRWKLDSKAEPPRTPYELRAGFVVPATLISGINSELPGQIMAQVSQAVYDTPTGKHLLIPQGSRLNGSYSSEVLYGQSRVLVAWQRIIFPDGKAMDIGAMPGADSSGYAGFNDQVNNHYLRIFGSAVLMSGVVAGVNLSQNSNESNNSNTQRASDSLSEALGQQLGQVTAQMIAKNMNIAPTLEIRPGFRFNVIATKDMTFSKPYQSFDY
jgi:type IV secretion system protein VirB10